MDNCKRCGYPMAAWVGIQPETCDRCKDLADDDLWRIVPPEHCLYDIEASAENQTA